jgi:hypothetical protein
MGTISIAGTDHPRMWRRLARGRGDSIARRRGCRGAWPLWCSPTTNLEGLHFHEECGAECTLVGDEPIFTGGMGKNLDVNGSCFYRFKVDRRRSSDVPSC